MKSDVRGGHDRLERAQVHAAAGFAMRGGRPASLPIHVVHSGWGKLEVVGVFACESVSIRFTGASSDAVSTFIHSVQGRA